VDDVELTLPVPPSANRMTRFVSGRGKVAHSSPEYRKWLAAASLQVMATRRGRIFSTPVKVLIAMRKPHPLADLDNYTIAQAFDALQRGGLITNDRIIHEVTAKWANVADDMMSVTVAHLD
jgi:Holliday junction resolvase RusA-like endonuclease